MIDTRNKPLLLLVGLNILALIAIFWLVGVLLSREAPAPATPAGEHNMPAAALVPDTPAVAPVAAEPAPLATASTSTPVATTQDTAPLAVVPPREPAAPVYENAAAEEPEPAERTSPTIVETVSNIDVYYDGSIIRLEESDNHGRRHTMISTSLKDIDRIAPQDAAYLTALRDLKAGRRSHVSMTQVTREMADEVIADDAINDEQVSEKAEVDHFNKVDVSASAIRADAVGTKKNLAARIADLVSEPEETSGENTDNTDYARASVADYIETLDAASSERANEMRTIRVQRGDSLWLIAQRAYGSGFSYPRIFEANPHIKNPHMIREGDILRVPL